MKFRKKSLVVEAEQLLEGKALPFASKSVVHETPSSLGLSKPFYLITAQGQRAFIDYGEWVILERDPSLEGRAYPCSNEIFVETYDPVKSR